MCEKFPTRNMMNALFGTKLLFPIVRAFIKANNIKNLSFYSLLCSQFTLVTKNTTHKRDYYLCSLLFLLFHPITMLLRNKITHASFSRFRVNGFCMFNKYLIFVQLILYVVKNSRLPFFSGALFFLCDELINLENFIHPNAH